jgi:hypothetical protein
MFKIQERKYRPIHAEDLVDASKGIKLLYLNLTAKKSARRDNCRKVMTRNIMTTGNNLIPSHYALFFVSRICSIIFGSKVRFRNMRSRASLNSTWTPFPNATLDLVPSVAFKQHLTGGSLAAVPSSTACLTVW